MNRGIDYGLGQTNIDKETGIRYGVIPMNSISQAWYDSSEADYGEPSCPSCGSPVVEYAHNKDYICESCLHKAVSNLDRDEMVRLLSYIDIQCYDQEDKDVLGKALVGAVMDGDIDEEDVGAESLWSDSVWGDEPLCHTLDDGEYKASQGGGDSDVFIIKSPYYTRAQFCSPCAPGAGYCLNPVEDGVKTYCFAPDWFDDGIEPCPYPVYRVDNDECIYTPESSPERE